MPRKILIPKVDPRVKTENELDRFLNFYNQDILLSAMQNSIRRGA